jgi:hypothetical protein
MEVRKQSTLFYSLSLGHLLKLKGELPMANQSSFHQNVVNVRAAGSKDQSTGLVLGGIYFPEHITKEGKQVSAHWEGQFFINQLGWTDAEGVFHEPKNIPIRITAWNGKNAAAGKGLADVFAKCVSVGKELSAALRIDYYMKTLYINNVAQTDHLGQPIKIPAYGWLIKSDLQWGADSSNVIAQEIANWQGVPNFYSRPPQWNTQGTADNEAWKLVVTQRMATIYQGESTYGYARVMIPEGAQIVNQAKQPLRGKVETPPQTFQGQQPTMPGMSPTGMTVPPPPAAVPPPPAPPALTYQQLIGAGWTDEQIRNSQYANLAQSQGQPPTSAATGMAPGATPLSNPAGI